MTDLQYWLKGGLIGLLIGLIGILPVMIGSSGYYIRHLLWICMPSAFLFKLAIPAAAEIDEITKIGFYIAPLTYFLIGAIIGFAIGKIKFEKEIRQAIIKHKKKAIKKHKKRKKK